MDGERERKKKERHIIITREREEVGYYIVTSDIVTLGKEPRVVLV